MTTNNDRVPRWSRTHSIWMFHWIQLEPLFGDHIINEENADSFQLKRAIIFILSRQTAINFILESNFTSRLQCDKFNEQLHVYFKYTHLMWTLEKWVKSAAKWISFKHTALLRHMYTANFNSLQKWKHSKNVITIHGFKNRQERQRQRTEYKIDDGQESRWFLFEKKKNDKHVRYLRGVKSSYFLNVVPSQRRVITFDFAHKNTPTNICQTQDHTHTNWKPIIRAIGCNAVSYPMQIKIRLGSLEYNHLCASIERRQLNVSIHRCEYKLYALIELKWCAGLLCSGTFSLITFFIQKSS